MSNTTCQVKNLDDLPAIITVKEFYEKVFPVSKVTAYEIVNRADFPKIRVNRRLYIPKEGLTTWLSKVSGC